MLEPTEGAADVAESVQKDHRAGSVGTSDESWEKAAAAAVIRASQSLRDLRIAEVAELSTCNSTIGRWWPWLPLAEWVLLKRFRESLGQLRGQPVAGSGVDRRPPRAAHQPQQRPTHRVGTAVPSSLMITRHVDGEVATAAVTVSDVRRLAVPAASERQGGGRNPASVTVTSRRTAALDGRRLAAVRACKQ